MLEEHEYARVEEIRAQYAPEIERLQPQINQSPEAKRQWYSLIEQRDVEVMRLFEEITGREPKEPFEVFHHRTVLYGPPCRQCGKPLRTPQAKSCLLCGWRLGEEPKGTEEVEESEQATEEKFFQATEFSRPNGYGLGISLSAYSDDDLRKALEPMTCRIREWAEYRGRWAELVVISLVGTSDVLKSFESHLDTLRQDAALRSVRIEIAQR